VRFSRLYATTAFGRPVRLTRVAGQVVGVVAERPEDADAFARAMATTTAWDLAALEHAAEARVAPGR
jgi:hypothetical protein